MKSRLQSVNFLASTIAIVLIFFNIQGVDTTLDPNQTANELLAKNWEFMSQVMIPSLMAMVFKLVANIKAGLFSWKKVIQSPNFITAAVTLIATLLTGLGYVIPATAGTEISDAILSGSTLSIIVAVLFNFANPLWHFIQDWINKLKAKKNDTNPVGV